MKRSTLAVCLLLLSACSKIDSDAAQVFASSFSMQSPPNGVVPLHGYRLEQRKFFVVSGATWRLHLGGPSAKDFVRQRWPDLRPAPRRAFAQGLHTPWFAPGREVKYITFVSAADPAVMVMQREDSDEVFVAYDQ